LWNYCSILEGAIKYYPVVSEKIMKLQYYFPSWLQLSLTQQDIMSSMTSLPQTQTTYKPVHFPDVDGQSRHVQSEYNMTVQLSVIL
jgi:hypothetical protein